MAQIPLPTQVFLVSVAAPGKPRTVIQSGIHKYFAEFSMAWLVLGVALWSFAHLFKRLAPSARIKMGAGGRGLVALAVLGSVGLMVHGYAPGEGTIFWGRSAPLVGINNLLMLVAVYFMAASILKSRITAKVRHPQLTAIKAWALAHLLVNGDTASFVLFGGLLAWAVLSVILINRAGKPALQVPAFSVIREGLTLLVTLVAFGGIAMLHMKAGYAVFG
jgi:uncharacterized membrane protein